MKGRLVSKLGLPFSPKCSEKQKRLIKMLVIVTEYHFFSGELQPKLKIKDVKVNFWKTTFMSIGNPQYISGAMSGLQEGIYPLFILIKMEYL